VRLNEFQQTRIECGESEVGEVFSCLGKGLGADCTKQISLVHQVGKEGIEFVLNSVFKAGQHGNSENRKSQDVLTEKSSGIKSRLSEELVRMKVINKVDKNGVVLGSS